MIGLVLKRLKRLECFNNNKILKPCFEQHFTYPALSLQGWLSQVNSHLHHYHRHHHNLHHVHHRDHHHDQHHDHHCHHHHLIVTNNITINTTSLEEDHPHWDSLFFAISATWVWVWHNFYCKFGP